MHAYNRSLALTVVILSVAIGASAQNIESDFGNTFSNTVDASNIPVSITVLSTVNSALDNLDQLNELKDGLASLRHNATELEQLRNAFNNEYVSLYSIGNGRAPIGKIDDAYRSLQAAISNVDDAVGRLSDFQTSARGFTTSVARGIGNTTRYVGTIGDVLAIASAANTFANEEATLVEQINGVSSLAGVAVTTYAPATGAVLAPVQLTLLASDKYVDATRNVATDILGQMEDDKAEYLNAARLIILTATANNPELKPQEILALASPRLNKLGQDYFEIYEYQGNLHRAVYGDGISRLASGLGNAASGGAVERRYLENLNFFSGILSDQNSELFQTLLTISTATSARVGSLNEIQSRIAQTLRQIEVTSGTVSSNLQQSFEIVQSIGQELETLSAPASPEADSDVALLSPSGAIESTSDDGLILTEDDEGKAVLGNNAGTNIIISTDPVEPEEPEEPTGPTPEEIAAMLAQLEAQREGLVDVRDLLYITKLQAEALIANNNDRLTILQFDDRETVQNTLSVVDEEIQSLRAELNSTGLSEADATRLQDLMRYGETLEGELDRISTEIASLEARNTEAQTALDTANSSIASNDTALGQNRSSILALVSGYSFTDYTVPTVTTDLPDWSSYEYELPPFNETEVPTSDIVNVVATIVPHPDFYRASTGNVRRFVPLVSGDGETLLYDQYDVDQNVTEKLEVFEHLYWGGNERLRWIYGEASTHDQFALRTGTATFRGGIAGNYVHGSSGSETVYEDSLYGGLGLQVDFSNRSISGEGTLGISSPVRNEELSFTINPAQIRLNSDNFTQFVSFYSTASMTGGASGDGSFSGLFYGSDASEAAGHFAFGLTGGLAVGIWAAVENYIPRDDEGGGGGGGDGTGNEGGGSSLNYSNYRGLFAFSGRDLQTGEYVTDFSAVTGISNDGDITVAGTTGTPNINDAVPDQRYSYSSWGTWANTDIAITGQNGQTANASGGWLVYEPTTDLPMTGTATYSGQVAGGIAGGDSLNGTINLNADFAADRVTGSMDINRSSGSDWASASFDTSITRDTNSSGFQGALTGTDVNSGAIFGGFAGPNAEEVGGGWQIDHADGSSANGIFRATQ